MYKERKKNKTEIRAKINEISKSFSFFNAKTQYRSN